MELRRLARRVIYRSRWVNLYVDRVALPDGGVIDAYHVLDFERQGVAALVEDDAGRILLVQAYRYALNALSWEIPAGGMEPGESPLETAAREALEETGWTTAGHRRLYTYYPSNGMSNQIFHVVGCRAGERVGAPDANEIKDTRWVTRDEARALIRDEMISDGFTLTALLLHLQAPAAD
jgi:ADP-ribose pyrophosphatase